MFQVDFCVYPGQSQGVQQVRDQGERVLVLLSNLVESLIVYTQSEAAIFLFDE